MVAQSAGVAESVPTSFLLTDVSSSPCVPVSRLPQHRDRVPFRCGLSIHTAQRVKAAQVVMRSGGGALALALTAVLDSESRTGGKRILTNTAYERMPVHARRNNTLREDLP
jgi:hypothetical protein